MLTKFGKNGNSLAWKSSMNVDAVDVEVMCEAFVTGKLSALFLIKGVRRAVKEERPQFG